MNGAAATLTAPPEQGQLVEVRAAVGGDRCGQELAAGERVASCERPRAAPRQPHLGGRRRAGGGAAGHLGAGARRGDHRKGRAAGTRPDSIAPHRLDAFLDAVRWGAASTADLRPSSPRSVRASTSRITSSIPWSGRFRCPGSTC